MSEAGEAEREEDDGTFTRRVEKDPGFARYYADSSTVHAIGAEIELAYLSIAPTLQEITWRQGSTQPVSVKSGGPVAELCRIRLDVEAASNLAFNILLLLTKCGEVPFEAVEKNLQIMKQEINDAGRLKDTSVD